MEIKLIKPLKIHTEQISKMIEDFKFIDNVENGISGSSKVLAYPNIADWIKFVNTEVPKNGMSPFKQYIAINENNDVVGFINLRLELNEYLFNFGGHIGYAISPQQRNKGYATEMLKQGLKKIKALGINDVLITCLENNQASEKVILNNGGVYENSLKENENIFKRFWIKL
ncbi:acetyltransferase [Williamsoniiplasma somnilux]|uniref:Acetyltransferase n=1 Tax=Williamsoniiplasma somnilux TaxID=215578 RepID=A0A2K8P0B2_9MOLU|nr:GNAT family N-acetyltransferase [Williamsoniiplasma somnilux]ATZ18441.1 acetyltransferase [Williamsoniiplasma somnilux]